jgi:hypothetical protein
MRDGEGWNEQADFWDRLEGFVARDGWTSNETYKDPFTGSYKDSSIMYDGMINASDKAICD